MSIFNEVYKAVFVRMADEKTGLEIKSGINKAESLESFKEKGLIDRAVKAAPVKGGRGDKFDTVPVYLIGRIAG